MPERKIEASTAKGDSASEQVTPQETRAQRKARLAQVFDRGAIGDRLHVDLPSGYRGEWVPTNDGGINVNRKKALGFWIDNEFAKKHSELHDKGDSGSHVGDVVFMVCTAETAEILDEIRRERYNEVHNPKGGKQKEELDYLRQADEETVPSAQSTVDSASIVDISDALKTAQTT
jgi:hypothetical protein